MLAVSVSHPQWRDVGGRHVFTSIVRAPGKGPLWFGPEGPEGNATAVHTEQVLACPAEHYDHWAGRFGAPRTDWDWCHWGENVTLTGLDENSLPVGAVVMVGAEARFEVTSPRIPCFKLAWRLGQPESVLGEMVRSGKVGFYLRALTPGWVGAGDEVRVEHSPAEAITVGDLSRLLTDMAMTNMDRLRAVLSLPALGDQARGMIRKRLARLQDDAEGRRGRWQGWRPFEIAEISDEAAEVKSFRLCPADGGEIAPALAGQFLAVRLADGELVRSWSVSGHDEAGYRITVKRLPGGAGSAWLHERARIGDRLELRPPAGRFVLDRSGFLRVVLISAGVGVTPMLAMLKAHLARGDEVPPILWLHVARSGRAHVHRQEAQGLIERGGVERRVFYTDPEAEDVAGRDYDHPGRPTPERLGELLGGVYRLSPFGRQIELTGRDSEFYICGPAPFESMVREVLHGLGVPAELIRSEAFVPRSKDGRDAAVQAAEVRFMRSGLSARWDVDQDLSLLELAEAAGIAAPFSCRSGLCQSCETRLVSGEVAYDPDPAVAPLAGNVLTCCARPAGPVVELDL